MADSYAIGVPKVTVHGVVNHVFGTRRVPYGISKDLQNNGTRREPDTFRAVNGYAEKNAGYRRWAYGVASVLLVAGLMACAWRQTSFWRDGETLWTRALACTSDNALVHNNLGMALASGNKLDAAAAHYRKALEIKPDYATAHNGLGKILADQGQSGEAIVEYRKAIEFDPDSTDAHNDLGVILANRGQLDAAIAQFQKTLEIRTDFAEVHGNLGTALERQGRIADAMIHWREAVRLQPGNPHAVNRLAWAMATGPEASVRNGAEAAELAQWGVQLSGGREPIPLGTLAAAYAEVGRFSEAVKTADRAISLAAARGDAATADALRRQSQIYRTCSPYHESPSPRLP